jgi:hypothetical protein
MTAARKVPGPVVVALCGLAFLVGAVLRIWF